MPHPFLNSLVAFGNRAIFRKGSCQLKIDQGEEKEQQENGMMESNYLPEELIIESILTRLPVRTLAVCSFVRKSWYDSILNDSRFRLIHNILNKNKPFLVFHILNNNVTRGSYRVCFFSFSEREKATDIRILYDRDFPNFYELAGFCNGLTCVNIVNGPDSPHAFIGVINQIRKEMFFLTYSRPAGGYSFLCQGFGFDSLSQVYKIVLVYTSEAGDEFLCMVVTLGTMSWRKILTTTSGISSPIPNPMFTRVSRMSCRQANFCGGDLYWRTKSKVRSNINDIEMLLSFDLHNEKIHFIQLPTECTTLTSTTPATERQYLADDYLLEFKGYPCIAHSERITTRSNNDHCGHRCNYKAGVCCCCYKIHMYILKDKEKQVWTREETFDVQIMDHKPLCCLIEKKTPAATPPTRMLTISDEVLLYWFNGERLILYNLQEKYLKAVECSRSYPLIFPTKMDEDLERAIGENANLYCPSMDYQLHAQVENIVSLKTFIPKEAKTSECDHDRMKHLVNNNLLAGWLTWGTKTETAFS